MEKVYPYETSIAGVPVDTCVVDEKGRVLECRECTAALVIDRAETGIREVSCPVNPGHDKRKVYLWRA